MAAGHLTLTYSYGEMVPYDTNECRLLGTLLHFGYPLIFWVPFYNLGNLLQFGQPFIIWVPVHFLGILYTF